jgi:hypothetical protein
MDKIINYETICEIIEDCNKGLQGQTRCGDSLDCLCYCLTGKEFDKIDWQEKITNLEYMVKKDKKYKYKSMLEITDMLEEYTKKHGIVYIITEIICKNNIELTKFEHNYTLINTEKGIMILDSYVNIRGLRQQPFEISKYKEMLIESTVKKWNSYFECKEDENQQIKLIMICLYPSMGLSVNLSVRI